MIDQTPQTLYPFAESLTTALAQSLPQSRDAYRIKLEGDTLTLELRHGLFFGLLRPLAPRTVQTVWSVKETRLIPPWDVHTRVREVVYNLHRDIKHQRIEEQSEYIAAADKCAWVKQTLQDFDSVQGGQNGFLVDTPNPEHSDIMLSAMSTLFEVRLAGDNKTYVWLASSSNLAELVHKTYKQWQQRGVL